MPEAVGKAAVEMVWLHFVRGRENEAGQNTPDKNTKTAFMSTPLNTCMVVQQIVNTLISWNDEK